MAVGKAKSIAVAVDGSAPGWEAMQRAINMAQLLALPLDVLHVIQLKKAGYFAFIDRHLQEEQESYAKGVLEEARRHERYEKPSDRRRRMAAASERRRRKANARHSSL